MIFNFFSRVINITKLPTCPRCRKVQLERRMSIFSFSRGRQDTENSVLDSLDEDRLEKAVQSLASDAENINENDPRQAAALMRKLYDATGLEFGSGMKEFVRRMESGEDPEKIEAEMGEMLENESPFIQEFKKTMGKKLTLPAKDDHLYEL